MRYENEVILSTAFGKVTFRITALRYIDDITDKLYLGLGKIWCPLAHLLLHVYKSHR